MGFPARGNGTAFSACHTLLYLWLLRLAASFTSFPPPLHLYSGFVDLLAGGGAFADICYTGCFGYADIFHLVLGGV